MHRPPRNHARPVVTAPGTLRPAQCKRSCARARLARVCTHRRLHVTVHNPLARWITTTSAGVGRQPHLPVLDRAARVHNPTCNDPLVLAHARALLPSTPQGACGYIGTDLRDTTTIVAQARRTLDFSQPVAILLLAVLHFIPDCDDPAGIVATLAGAVAPGSLIAVSHLTADFAPQQVAAAAAAYNALAAVPVTPRTHTQVSGLLGGLPLLAPGVVPAGEWRPRTGAVAQPCDLYAGVAHLRRGHR
jgi:hypothetical protein